MHEHAGETAQIEAPLAGHGDTAPAVTVDALAFHTTITASGETRELAAENPVQRDLSGEHEAAVAWPLVCGR
ncbi:hypothetical protein [Candidatus Poriferisodalis sp.]|uniref:hypothetical protein n=1 Tax=Candidatus Poriferisodalis sp. TaxID=3101277 RepID=UPI003B0299ED